MQVLTREGMKGMKEGMKENVFFIKLQDNSCARFLCVFFYATMKFSGLIITGKAFMICFYFFIFVFFGGRGTDENSA